MRHIWVFGIIFVCMLVIAGCSKDSLPYKSLSDTKLSSPTGKVVADVQKQSVSIVEETPAESSDAVKTASNLASCHDTDYGKMTTAAGKVKGTLNDGSDFEESDACVGDVLYEYYCEGSSAEFFKEVCNRGCKNGFCI
ncbi:hypothetical protein HY484_01550 [Candidatus Woesearchaeota archaeon]|nr:hypothetical protein [Candidatus Woesearchaeota archaeon]